MIKYIPSRPFLFSFPNYYSDPKQKLLFGEPYALVFSIISDMEHI